MNKPKKALITGGGSGIGAATAELFKKNGVEVILVGRKKRPGLNIEICDLSVPKEIENLVTKIGSVDCLVNNAGIIERSDFVNTDMTSWQKQFETNLFGPVLLTKLLIKKMYEAKSGIVVNVASSLGVRSVASTSAYSATKAAMISWTQTLALEAAPYGVRVNSVSPGIVATPILTDHKRDLNKDEIEQYNQMHPLGRLGRPEEIAEAIWHLSTSDWTTGCNMIVDGGISL